MAVIGIFVPAGNTILFLLP